MDQPNVVPIRDEWHYITAYRSTWDADHATRYVIIAKGNNFSVNCNGQAVVTNCESLATAKQAARDDYKARKGKS